MKNNTSIIVQKLLLTGQHLERGLIEYSGAEADVLFLLEEYKKSFESKKTKQ